MEAHDGQLEHQVVDNLIVYEEVLESTPEDRTLTEERQQQELN